MSLVKDARIAVSSTEGETITEPLSLSHPKEVVGEEGRDTLPAAPDPSSLQ